MIRVLKVENHIFISTLVQKMLKEKKSEKSKIGNKPYQNKPNINKQNNKRLIKSLKNHI
jgi:hypothetical protein